MRVLTLKMAFLIVATGTAMGRNSVGGELNEQPKGAPSAGLRRPSLLKLTDESFPAPAYMAGGRSYPQTPTTQYQSSECLPTLSLVSDHNATIEKMLAPDATPSLATICADDDSDAPKYVAPFAGERVERRTESALLFDVNDSSTGPLSTQSNDTQPVVPEKQSLLSLSEWSFSATATTYIVPHGRSYVQPTLTADHHWLHLEARYNYEGLDTGSLFAGYNFSFGDKVTLEFTPLIGAVFGNTNGLAPGYKLTLSYEGFELYTEGEYLFDTDDSAGNFFYTWSEFSYSPTDWLRVGIVIQRTKVYKSDLDIQRGLLLGLSYKELTFTAYVFNLGWEDPTFVLSVGASF